MPDRPVRRGSKGRRVMQVPKGLRVFRGHRDHLGLPGRLERLVRLASKVRPGRRVMWGPSALQVRLGLPG
jgi:hypothetical protein